MNAPRQNSALVVDRPLLGGPVIDIDIGHQLIDPQVSSSSFFLSNSHTPAHPRPPSTRAQAAAHTALTATSPSRHSLRTPSFHLSSVLRSAFTRRAVTMSSDRQPKYRQEIQQVSASSPFLIFHGKLQCGHIRLLENCVSISSASSSVFGGYCQSHASVKGA